jgi:hypothetical protein
MSLAPDADVGSRTTFSFPHRAELLDCRLSRSFYSGSSRTTQTQFRSASPALTGLLLGTT